MIFMKLTFDSVLWACMLTILCVLMAIVISI